MLNVLAPDHVQKIFSFLSQEEAFALRLTCQAFNIAATSNEIMMPFLNRLKALDLQISTLPPQETNLNWAYERFIAEFTRLAKEQEEEIISLLKEKEHLIEFEIAKDQRIKLLEIYNQTKSNQITLEVLEKRHQAIESFNIGLISSCINVNSTTLYFSYLPISRFPEALFSDAKYQDYWKEVQTIICQTGLLKSLPFSLGHCSALQTLKCAGNQLKTLPETLGHCLALVELNCNSNQLKALPETLGNCAALEILDCARNQIQSLPESLCKCSALKKLFCYKNRLKTLPTALGDCTLLEALYCDKNQLELLPESLSECQKIHTLDCSKNKLTSLPSLKKCENLAWLHCESNQLTNLTPTIGECQNLNSLYCQDNLLEVLPESLGDIPTLAHILCGHNKLKTLPDTLGNCQLLFSIRCDNNEITALPTPLSNCTSLVEIQFQQNYITAVPSEIIRTVTNNCINKGFPGFIKFNEMLGQQKAKLPSPPALPPQPLKPLPSPTKPHNKNGFIFLMLSSFILTSLLVAFGGGFTYITALLLKIGLEISITKTVLFMLSIAAGLTVSFVISGLYCLGRVTRTTFNHVQHKTCDEQLSALAKQFSTSTGQAFIHHLKSFENLAPQAQRLQFKQFEINACKKVAPLKDIARNSAKDAVFQEAKTKFSWIA
ncbi:MAG: hypothetical protein JSS07_06870 [Proteobacteria bacterium]|nr:hypothetical protein [Pseudomonadota bacterium]